MGCALVTITGDNLHGNDNLHGTEYRRWNLPNTSSMFKAGPLPKRQSHELVGTGNDWVEHWRIWRGCLGYGRFNMKESSFTNSEAMHGLIPFKLKAQKGSLRFYEKSLQKGASLAGWI